MDVKVGQVWREKFAHREFTVLPHEEYQLIDNETTWLWSAPASDFGCDLELVKDVSHQPSDLEIVQKALLKVECSLDIDRRGQWWVGDGKMINNNYRYSGKSMQSLLTWAKQTIGVE